MRGNASCIAVFIFTALIVAGCSANSQPNTADHAHSTPPPEYAGMTNPLPADEAAALGRELYAVNCASCHGEKGLGDGPAAAALNPPPRPLAAEMHQAQDDYLYWRISEGGAMAPFHSVMPAWKKVLSSDQIWQVIAFLRTLS